METPTINAEELKQLIEKCKSKALTMFNPYGESLACEFAGKVLDAIEDYLDGDPEPLKQLAGEGTTPSMTPEQPRCWGQYSKALEYYEKSLGISRKIGNLAGE